MEATKRMSLNTSLKNAKIFETFSDDEDTLTIEKLIKQETEKIKIKTEPQSQDQEVREERNHKIQEPKEVTFDLSRVKQEIREEDIKDVSISSAVAEMQLKTPIKNEEDDHKNKPNLKSAKRSLLRQRNSPYSKDVSSTYSTRSTVAKKITPYEELARTTRNLNRNRNYRIQETDSEVLRRRQKQIDFGKNTIGYDNYVRVVPRAERSPDDPTTPNKHRVYSRRGFDGLIKQWRLKLHKYDP